MKKSVALLAVLGFIIILITLSTALLKIYDSYSKSSYTYIVQDKLIIKDIKQILQDYIKQSNSINNIYNTYPIADEDIRMIVKISPILNKININNYFDKNKTNRYIDDTLNNLLDYYEILDPMFFKNLLLDTMDTDDKERDAYSEIKLYKEFQNGAIYNKVHFKQILDYYFEKTDDKNIYKIPWDNYIFFGKNTKYILDCNFIDKNLANFIGLKFKNDIISCKNLDKDKISNAFNVKGFDKNTTYLLQVDIDYNQNKLSFLYDTKQKKVISIEKHFIY